MNVKRFRTVSKISAYVLRGLAVFVLLFVTFGLYNILIGNSDGWFTYPGPSFHLFTSGGSMNGIMITDAEYRQAALIMAPILAIFGSYIFWKGGSLFKELADDNSPFTTQFAKSLKHLSIILILTDIAFPIIHSTILSIIYKDGHHFTIGLTGAFIIGVILYAVSEVFSYGIELQTLSDETV